MAPLLPKLRGHFAEFLGNASPAGLRILSSSTCVGLRYGCCKSHSGFSWHSLRALRYFLSLLSRARIEGLFCLPFSFPASAGPSVPGPRFLHASPQLLSYSSTGISTCCPSATPSGLALGPDLPRADQLYPGILGYPAKRIPTSFSLLIPAFSLPAPPPALTAWLRRDSNAPLPAAHERSPRASAACFSPGHFRRRASRLVSYYALFQCMAASEPTS